METSPLKRQLLLALIVAAVQLISSSCEGTPKYTPPITGVAFVSPDEAWVLTRKGSVVRVSASGQTDKPTGAPKRIEGISFIDPSQGWAVDAYWNVWRFDGINWAFVGHNNDNRFGLIERSEGLIFVDERNGWARTLEGLFVTDDAGRNWTKVLVTEPGELIRLSVVDRDTPFLYGNHGEVKRSTDRGKTWKDIYLGCTGDVRAFACRERTDRECWAACRSEIFKISGDSVGRLYLPETFGKISISSISFKETGGALLAGGTYGERPVGWLLKTDEEGQAWQKLTPPQDSEFEHVASFGNTIWLASNTAIYRSSDDGGTWSKVYDADQQ